MLAVVMEFATWLVNFLFSKRKTYQGKHWPETVIEVVPEYHPDLGLARYQGLWVARMRGSVDYLRVPLKALYALSWVGREIDKAIWLNDYRWRDVPLNEWPESWRVT